ncbi:nucleotidyltransferase family protein [Photobacterium sp. CCB-ST2H9]|uniref:nucleotidyltransferase family protein n=1 Tax=Photobacterium sp. CCB-ST2H9 TaxID=2912855 RepID=UPI00200403E7|nr:nucleotidyltransferase family protein [Photobacterium sp. CCB-ST2H9]UTM56009.1 nucleotidyltransferase family protein [Photobacterium sp. CCB-ST2H9]
MSQMLKQEAELADRLSQWLRQDDLRMSVLAVVESLNLPQAYVGAGFVRNLVWDHLHGYNPPTSLNDVDVVYFDPSEQTQEKAWQTEAQLNREYPFVVWQVRNQALMHTRNGDQPYTSTMDAISYWVECETAVAARSVAGELDIIACFGLTSLFAGCLTHNPRRPFTAFQTRVAEKQWLEHWPGLKVVVPHQPEAPTV